MCNNLCLKPGDGKSIIQKRTRSHHILVPCTHQPMIPNLHINNVVAMAEHTPSAYLNAPLSRHSRDSAPLKTLAAHGTTYGAHSFRPDRSVGVGLAVLRACTMARTMRAAPKHLVQQCTPPRPLFSVVLIALCLAASNLPPASSADSCSNGLSLGSLVPFNTTGLTCFQAWPSQDFVLRVRSGSAPSAHTGQDRAVDNSSA